MSENAVNRKALMRYVDDELSPEERARVERELRLSPQLRRDVATFRALKADLASLSFTPLEDVGSVWGRTRPKITVRTGWILASTGAVAWLTYATWLFFTSSGDMILNLAIGAVGIGILLILVQVIVDRAREFRTDPYRDIHR